MLDYSELEIGYICSITASYLVYGEGDKDKLSNNASLYELAYVGHKKLLGEIIKIDSNLISIQLFEDARGLSVGDPIILIHQNPLISSGNSEEVKVFLSKTKDDGSTLKNRDNNIFAKLDSSREWEFKPSNLLREGQLISGGDISFQYENKKYLLKLAHYWPIRKPRPYLESMAPTNVLSTEIRVIDSLFPCVMGGTCAIPGAYGAGKGTITQSIAKYSNSDALVYVGCGERGNGVCEILSDFPMISLPTLNIFSTENDHQNLQQSNLMKRTSIIANTSNMSPIAREASIYTGITIAEYYRDKE
eukprot:gene8253-11168_t